MYPIDPGEEWGEYAVIGGLQTEYTYEPLHSRQHPDGPTVTRWRLTEAERSALANVADLYLSVLCFGQPLQPLNLWVKDEGQAR